MNFCITKNILLLVIDCGLITPLHHGTIKYIHNATYVGSEATFSCAVQHKLNGVAKRTCLGNGQWSDYSPKCEEIRCTEPAIVPHSFLSVTGNDRMYGRTLIRTTDNAGGAQTYK